MHWMRLYFRNLNAVKIEMKNIKDYSFWVFGLDFIYSLNFKQSAYVRSVHAHQDW